MTPCQRVQLAMRSWSQRLSLPPEGPNLTALEGALAAEIDAAVAQEREACAAIVDRYLSCRVYHPRGIPAAIRERAGQSSQHAVPAAAEQAVRH
jgi:hypothetical protein